jgi:hypothetical protein
MLPENVLPFRGRGFLGYVSYSLSGVKILYPNRSLTGVGGSEGQRKKCNNLKNKSISPRRSIQFLMRLPRGVAFFLSSLVPLISQ